MSSGDMSSGEGPHAFEFTEAATPLLVLGIAEVPPPEESLVWMLVDHMGAALSDRVDRGAGGFVVPDLIKLRGVTPRVPALLRASRRAVVVTGTRLHGGDLHLVYRHHPAADRILTASPTIERARATCQPDGLLLGTPDPADGLDACLAAGTPLGGLDHLVVPLPARGSTAWMIPHLGTWLGRMSGSLVDAVWAIMLDEGRPGRRDGAA